MLVWIMMGTAVICVQGSGGGGRVAAYASSPSALGYPPPNWLDWGLGIIISYPQVEAVGLWIMWITN